MAAMDATTHNAGTPGDHATFSRSATHDNATDYAAYDVAESNRRHTAPDAESFSKQHDTLSPNNGSSASDPVTPANHVTHDVTPITHHVVHAVTPVIYGPITWNDVDAITCEFDNTWGHCSSASGTPASIELSRHFTLHYLEAATDAVVAHDHDGQFLGVILVRVVGKPQLFPQAKQALAETDRRINQEPIGARALHETIQWHDLEEDLEERCNINDVTQAEIELFLVSSAARGRGVGGTLWRKAMQIFADAGVHRYYLHTDSSCDVSFYDHKGLDRSIAWYAAEHPEYGSNMDDVFIYAGDVTA